MMSGPASTSAKQRIGVAYLEATENAQAEALRLSLNQEWPTA